MTKIFCWINSGHGTKYQIVCAMDEHGYNAGDHNSSSDFFAKYDIGISSPKHYRHEFYKKAYPKGYELVWVDEPMKNIPFLEALKKHANLTDANKNNPPKFLISATVVDDKGKEHKIKIENPWK